MEFGLVTITFEFYRSVILNQSFYCHCTAIWASVFISVLENGGELNLLIVH